METIKDLWASLVAYANERSTNPLTSAFFLTWAGWNYKFFVVLLNNETSAEKFEAIEELYPRTGEKCPLFDALCPSPESPFLPPDAFWGSAFVYPALMTLFYVFIYPYITDWVVSFYRKRQIVIANNLKKVEGQRVRTVEEVAAMVRRYEQRLHAVDLEAGAARNEVDSLRNALTAAEAQVKGFLDAVPAPTPVGPDEGEVRNPAPSSGVRDDRVFQQYSWQVKDNDGSIRMQTLTVEQARILHLVGKTKPKSSSEIASKLKLELDAVNLDIRVLVQIGAMIRTNGTFELTPDGKGILGVVNTNGLIDELNDEAVSLDLALAKNKRTAVSDFKI